MQNNWFVKQFLFLSFLLLYFIVMSCTKKDDDDPVGPENNITNPTNSGIILGTVRDVFGNTIPNVSVSLGNSKVQTNEQGYFTVPDLSALSRAVVAFSKLGYVYNQRITQVVVGDAVYVDAVLMPEASEVTVSGSGGGEVNSQGVKLNFESNSFVTKTNVPYTNDVKVVSTLFDPTTDFFTEVFPGEFVGVRQADGAEVPLESFGFIDVNLKGSNGEPLQLANGKKVNITYPIPDVLLAAAPDVIPMWYYDTTSGSWREEGSAIKTGNSYIGEVSHFTPWNWDKYFERAFLTGKVVDLDGNPVSGAKVLADGVDYNGQSTAYTSSDGTFTLGVRFNSVVTVQASKGGIKSVVINVNSPAANTSIDIGNIILSPPLATITTAWNLVPEDIDSHFLIPPQSSGGASGHVYFGEQGSRTSYPYAELDTDDVDGLGPEIITVVRLFEGVYKFYIHNFSVFDYCESDTECSESGFLTQSGATVNLIVGGSAYNFNVPSSNPDNKPVWSVFEISVGADKKVTVKTINEFTDVSVLQKSGQRLMK